MDKLSKLKKLYKNKSKPKSRPTKKAEKTMSPKSFQKKFPQPPPPLIQPLNDIKFIDIPLNSPIKQNPKSIDPIKQNPKSIDIQKPQYIEQYIRIGRKMKLVKIPLNK